MSVLFRIAVPADEALFPDARITARQLAAFRRYLRAEGDRIGVDLLEPDEYLGNSFEVRVCPLALAAVTSRFDHDVDVITVVEEAQFRRPRAQSRLSSPDSCPGSLACRADPPVRTSLRLAGGARRMGKSLTVFP